jgi:drug/metabolite transporter (DMT)-like permease
MPDFFVSVDVILAIVSAGLIISGIVMLCRPGLSGQQRASAGISMCIGGMTVGQSAARLIRGTPLHQPFLENALVLSAVPFLAIAAVIIVRNASTWFERSTR